MIYNRSKESYTTKDIWDDYINQNKPYKIRNKIAEQNIALARKITHRYAPYVPVDYLDLEQEGFIGLIKAIERFDPSRNIQFSSYAVPFIRGEILMYLRHKGGLIKIPQHLQELEKKESVFVSHYFSTKQRFPTEQEISTHLGYSLKDYKQQKEYLNNVQEVVYADQLDNSWDSLTV